MTNKEILNKKLLKLDSELSIGVVNDNINLLNKPNLNKVIDELDNGYSTDVDVFLNRKAHVVEICFVDNEVDFLLISKEDYIGRYGNERYEK